MINQQILWLVMIDSMCSILQVLVLRELAVHAPTLFYQQIQAFFDNIFLAVRDSKVTLNAN